MFIFLILYYLSIFLKFCQLYNYYTLVLLFYDKNNIYYKIINLLFISSSFSISCFSSKRGFVKLSFLLILFKKFKVDYRVIPWTTFIDPEVARVGINERDAAEQDIDVEVTRYEFAELDRAVAESARKGFIKVLTPPGKDKILGVTIVSEHAGDLLAEFVIAMKHDLGLNKILGTIHAYPTWAEGAKYAAGNWKRANAPEKLLSYVEKFHTWRRG